jgi:hypothetical protein
MTADDRPPVAPALQLQVHLIRLAAAARERRRIGWGMVFCAGFFAVIGSVEYMVTGRVELLMMAAAGAGANVGNALWLLLLHPVSRLDRIAQGLAE